MTFSLLQGCDGQAIAVDLRTDVHHPHYRHPRLLRAHRRYPHAAHRSIAGPVQHSDAAVAHVELIPGTIPCQARRDRHRPACCRQHAIGRLPLAAVLRQPGDDTGRNPYPHLPARLLPRRGALPGTQVGAETAAARRLQGRSVLPQDLRQPAQARQRHGPAPEIRRLHLHDGHERHRHGPVDGRCLRGVVRRRARHQRARHLQHPVIDHQRRCHHHDGRLHRPAHVGHDGRRHRGEDRRVAIPARSGVAGGEQIGGNADCAVFIGAVGGGDCGGGEGIIINFQIYYIHLKIKNHENKII